MPRLFSFQKDKYFWCQGFFLLQKSRSSDEICSPPFKPQDMFLLPGPFPFTKKVYLVPGLFVSKPKYIIKEKISKQTVSRALFIFKKVSCIFNSNHQSCFKSENYFFCSCFLQWKTKLFLCTFTFFSTSRELNHRWKMKGVKRCLLMWE